MFHDGVDISVDDAHPEQPAPFGHTHKVYALEGGTVWLPPIDDGTPCHSRSVRIGRFGYGDVDALGTVVAGEHVDAGELIGWTCKNEWHLHLLELSVAGDLELAEDQLAPRRRRARDDPQPPRGRVHGGGVRRRVLVPALRPADERLLGHETHSQR